MTLHGYATKQELLNLLEDYLGYKENHRAPKKYHLEIQDWPYHSLDSAYETKEDFHVCELYSAEWNAVRKEYGVIEFYDQRKTPSPPLYGCPRSIDIEEKKEVETKIEIVYF